MLGLDQLVRPIKILIEKQILNSHQLELQARRHRRQLPQVHLRSPPPRVRRFLHHHRLPGSPTSDVMKTPLAQTAFWTRVRLRIMLKLSPSVSPGVPLEDTSTQALNMESNVSVPTRLSLALSKGQKLNARCCVPEIVCLITL